jgi:KDO2-lipid IV(A) lauroyltransferase
MRGRIIIALLRTLSLLPLRGQHAVGWLIGWGMFVGNSGPCRVARRNLSLCFPEKSEPEREALLRASLIETGKTVTELAAMWFWPADKVLGLIREMRGEEHLLAMAGKGVGALALTPHLGQWEMMGLVAPRYMPITSLYRPMRMRELEQTITTARQRSGNRLAPTTAKGIRQVFAAIQRHEMVGILPDQVPSDGGGAFAPFFGIEAYSMSFVSRLAASRDVTVVITYAERLPKSRGYRIVAMPVDEAIHSTDLPTSLQALNASVERAVRELPEQYQWVYKRFKKRPPGEASFY